MKRSHYEKVSDRMMETVEPFDDPFEKVGINEAYLELTSRTSGDFQQAQQVAAEIKRKIVEQEQITCTIGVAPSKLLAKIASDRNKPDGLAVVRLEDVNVFLAGLAVNKIPRVGRNTEQKLDQLKIRTIDQLATLGVSVLRETFGRSLGTYLYRVARVKDDEPAKESIQHNSVELRL
jgi:DNA polymerase IV (DinB-like DNA polymerase)